MSGPVTADPARISLQADIEGGATLVADGAWSGGSGVPGADEIAAAFSGKGGIKSLRVDVSRLSSWGSELPVFLLACRRFCESRGIAFDTSGLPSGVLRLIELCDAVPETDAGLHEEVSGIRETVGRSVVGVMASTKEAVGFVGESLIAFWNACRGKALFRWSDVFLTMQQCGAEALPIVALINFLVGLIMAFVGAVQLAQFGATIYVADLVAVAVTREMGAIMTGIIVCGRTGAAFAAQLGTMKVNQEVDALKTFGFSPVEFLVFPRLLSLFVMMPILCVFADLLGILGGVVVGLALFDLSWVEYYHETLSVMTLTNFFIGLVKGSVFGVIVAITGCLRGVQCGNSSASVGLAATSAVVTGITGIIVADADLSRSSATPWTSDP